MNAGIYMENTKISYGYLYDRDNRLTGKVVLSKDKIEGPSNVIDRYFYTNDGHVEKIGNDINGDGKFDSIKTYAYDSMGNVTRFLNTAVLGGKEIALIETFYEYDEHGNVTSTKVRLSNKRTLVESKYDYACWESTEGESIPDK